MKKTELLSRIIVFLALVLIVTPCYVLYSQNRYDQGVNLKKQEYIAEYDKYKNELLNSKRGVNFIYSLIVTFVGLLIIVGGYETIVFLVSLPIKKLIKDTVDESPQS